MHTVSRLSPIHGAGWINWKETILIAHHVPRTTYSAAPPFGTKVVRSWLQSHSSSTEHVHGPRIRRFSFFAMRPYSDSRHKLSHFFGSVLELSNEYELGKMTSLTHNV